MAQQHKQIFRDNYCLISDDDLITLIRNKYNNKEIEDFIIKSNSFDIINFKKKLHVYLTKYIIDKIGLLFANAYLSKKYDDIEKYISDNNIMNFDIEIVKSKHKMDYILKETIQDNLNINKYIIKKELREYFVKVFPDCLNNGLMKYVDEFFISNK